MFMIMSDSFFVALEHMIAVNLNFDSPISTIDIFLAIHDELIWNKYRIYSIKNIVFQNKKILDQWVDIP